MHSLSKDQRAAVLEKAKQSGNRRDYLMMLIQFNHGLRAGELVKLTTENVKDGMLRVRRLKQRKNVLYSEHPLTVEEQELLATWKPDSDGTLFGVCQRQYQRIFKRYCLAAGISPHLAHPHTARHTCAILSLKGGAPINAVQKFMAHASLASTGQYLKVTDAEASAACLSAMAV